MGLFDAGARGEPATQGVSGRILTVPNAITVVRLVGLPVFAWLVLGAAAYGVAFWVLLAIGATDWVDGYVARRFDQVSRLGILLDPLVDRAVLATALVTLLLAGIVPAALVAAVLLRDVLVLGGALVLFGRIPRELRVNRLGKTATAALLLGIPLLLAAAWLDGGVLVRIAQTITVVGVAAYYASGVQYALAAAQLRRRSE